MAIIFNENTRQFYLHTTSTSYVMELYEGHLSHVYWGKRLPQVPALEALYPFFFGADFSATDIPGRRFNSTDKLPQEYPTFGSADMREPALHVRHADGSAVTQLCYVNHKIRSGKPALAGLPATYGTDTECETLEITLADGMAGLRAILLYTVFPEKDVLTRSVRIENHGQTPFAIEKAASCSLDFPDSNFQLIHLPGAWARERHMARTDLTHGSLVLDSKRGASSHNENPFMALVRPGTDEISGDAYGFCFVYSGNFCASATVEQFGSTRVQMGINPFDFCWDVAPGSSFQAPEVIMVYSDRGIGEMSRRFHRIIRSNVCRGKYRDTQRPVLHIKNTSRSSTGATCIGWHLPMAADTAPTRSSPKTAIPSCCSSTASQAGPTRRPCA